MKYLVVITCLLALVRGLSTTRRHQLENKFKIRQNAMYNNYEHFYAGDVPLRIPDFSDFLGNKPLRYVTHNKASDMPLRMPWSKPNNEDSNAFTLPMLTCSAGDYWAPYDKSDWLCDPATNTEARLLKQFDTTPATFALNDNGKSILRFESVFDKTVGKEEPVGLRAIREKIEKHRALFRDKMDVDGAPSKEYITQASSFGAALSVVTNTVVTTFMSPVGQASADAAALLVNDDHFTWCAKSAYHTGHTAAQKAAFEAGKKYASLKSTGDKSKDTAALRAIEAEFHLALAKGGFASHFLSDLFSAGHVRTPRYELRNECPDPARAGLTSNVMHDEDNYNGLYVSTGDGRNKWVTYGDHFLFEKKARPALARHQQALGVSFSEITQAFANGLKTHLFEPEYSAFGFLPTLSGLTDFEKQLNPCPLYRYEVTDIKGQTKGRWWIRLNRGWKAFPYTPFAQENTLLLAIFRSPDSSRLDLERARIQLGGSYAKAKKEDLMCEYELLSSHYHCCQVKGRSTPLETRRDEFSAYSNLCKGVESPYFIGGPTQRFYPSP